MPPDCIYCIAPARSGTHYLSRILGCFDGVLSRHEPNPTGGGQGMHDYWNGNEMPLKVVVMRKLRQLETVRQPVYADINAQFINGWGWLISPGKAVIVLHRDKAKVIDSCERLDFLPTTNGFMFMPLHCTTVGDYYDWAHSQSDLYFTDHPEVKRIDVQLEDLNALDGVQQLAEQLGLSISLPKLKKVLGRPTNLSVYVNGRGWVKPVDPVILR